MNKAVIAMDKSKSYRVYLAITTKMVEEARNIHNTTPLSTAAMGRVLTGAGLMGLLLKNGSDKLTLQVKGEGPAGQILATANGDGKVKGYISNTKLDLPLAEGKFDVGGSIGIGNITVIKDLGLKEPYVGKIDLVTGEIADDLTAYFFISEQQSSAVALGEKIDTDGKVLAAGGMIIQMLPDADTKAIDELEVMLDKMPPLSRLIEDMVKDSKGKTEEAILAYLLGEIFKDLNVDYQPEILEYRNIEWHCDCNVERIEKVIISIGEKDLKEIIEEDGQAELVCQFCEKKYHFDKAQLEDLLLEAMGKPRLNKNEHKQDKPKPQGGYLRDLMNNSDRF